jgi:hypothetical protein
VRIGFLHFLCALLECFNRHHIAFAYAGTPPGPFLAVPSWL